MHGKLRLAISYFLQIKGWWASESNDTGTLFFLGIGGLYHLDIMPLSAIIVQLRLILHFLWNLRQDVFLSAKLEWVDVIPSQYASAKEILDYLNKEIKGKSSWWRLAHV